MQTLTPEHNFINRVDINAIPEGWSSIGRLLVEKFDEAVERNEIPEQVAKDWKISSIDFNKNGKLTVSGTHIKHFEAEILDVAAYAEHVCSICGETGAIEKTKYNILMPLCERHLISANAI